MCLEGIQPLFTALLKIIEALFFAALIGPLRQRLPVIPAFLVRCQAGTTEPNWSITAGSDVGRIYNQTNDINTEADTYSYVASSWVDYPKQ